jgi:hypothetical protein
VTVTLACSLSDGQVLFYAEDRRKYTYLADFACVRAREREWGLVLYAQSVSMTDARQSRNVGFRIDVCGCASLFVSSSRVRICVFNASRRRGISGS